MKILSVKMLNLASLEGEQEVNFDAEPLNSAGLFLITGPTGAGKSTILDAICLALYGNTPRFNNADQMKFDNNVTNKDPRNILRKGVTEGYAEVIFVGANGQQYRSRWQTARTRNQTFKGPAQITVYELGNSDPLASGLNEAKEKLVELIGLTYEQFTRTVILAQNEFATFLKAKVQDKADLLEKLTGTEIYDQIARKISDHYKESLNNLERIKQRIKDIPLLPDEEYATKLNTFTEISEQLKLQDTKTDALKKKEGWYQEYEHFTKICEEDALLIKKTAEELTKAQPLKEELQKINSVEDARELLNIRDRTFKEWNETLQRLNSEQARSEQLSTQKENIEKSKNKLSEDLKKEQKINDELQPILKEARELDTQLHSMQELCNRLNTGYESKLNDLKELFSALQDLDEKFEQIMLSPANFLKRYGTKLNEEKKALQDKKTTWSTKQKILEQTDIKALHAKRQKLIQQKTATEVLIRIWSEMASIINEGKSLREAVILLKENINKRKELIEKNNKSHIEIEAKEEEARKALEMTQLATKADVEEMRATLQEGTPCPICGSTSHAYHAETSKHLHSLVEEMRKNLDKLVDQRKSLEKTQQTDNEKQSAEIALQQSKEMRINELLIQFKTKQNEWAQYPVEEMGLTSNLKMKVSEQNLQIDLLNDIAKRTADELLKTEKEENDYERQNKQLITESQRNEKDHELLSNRSINYQKLEQAFKETNEAKTEKELRQQDLDILKEKRKLLLKNESADKVETEQSNRLKAVNQELDSLLKTEEDCSKQYNLLIGSIKKEQLMCASKEQENKSANKTLAGWINAYNQNAPMDEVELKRLLSINRTVIEQYKIQLQELDNRMNKLVGQQTANQKSLKNHLQKEEKPDEEKETKELLHKWIEEAQNQTNEWNKKLREVDYIIHQQKESLKKIAGFEAEIKDKEHIYNNWLELNSLYGSYHGKNFKLLAQTYTLGILTSLANTQLKGLTPRYSLKQYPQTLILIIVDHDMGDEIRPVSSLSGGESFLVSLSLALGLSALSSRSMQISSLFIDEGFGTLDNESLSLTMNALEQLRSQGRKVGVISHADEMNDGIKTQIRVEKLSNGRSKIHIVG